MRILSKRYFGAVIFLSVCVMFSLLVFPADASFNTRSGVVIMEFEPKFNPHAKEIKLWIPYPVSNHFQRIEDVNIKGNHSVHSIYSDGVNGNMILFVQWDGRIKNPKMTLQFRASRDEIVRKDFPEKEAPWSKSDYLEYFKSYRLSSLNKQVKDLSNEITSGKTSVLAKARAIYDWVVENMFRDPAVKGCGDGDVCRLLEYKGGKCADINSVYVALARAADIPSREVFGLRLGKDMKNDITKWQHCWAEFYLPGYGWVPVDPGDVRKMMLVKNLKLADTKAKEYREYFFGAVDQYRIELSTGKDIVLNPLQNADPLNYFMYPHMEIDGKVSNSLTPDVFQYRFTFQEL